MMQVSDGSAHFRNQLMLIQPLLSFRWYIKLLHLDMSHHRFPSASNAPGFTNTPCTALQNPKTRQPPKRLCR